MPSCSPHSPSSSRRHMQTTLWSLSFLSLLNRQPSDKKKDQITLPLGFELALPRCELNFATTKLIMPIMLHLHYNHILALTLDTFHFHEDWPITCFPRAAVFSTAIDSIIFSPPPHDLVSPSFWKSQLTSRAHNLAIPLPIVFTSQIRSNKG